MPNGTTLEQTAAATRALADEVLKQPEVVDLQTYTGTASPYNFNGLVRHYYLRRGSNIADIQVNLLGKHDRSRQSHEIAKAVRNRLLPWPLNGARASKSPRCRPPARSRDPGGGGLRALRGRPH